MSETDMYHQADDEVQVDEHHHQHQNVENDII
jgi:hypothetical protein